MKCCKCGEEWDTLSGKSHSFCPNCGSKVEYEKKAVPNLDTAQGVLAHIANVYGVDKLLGVYVHSYFADLSENLLPAEKELIELLSKKGALDCLKAVKDKSEEEHTIAIKNAVARLPFAKAEGEEMLCNFAAALGWKLSNESKDTLPPKVTGDTTHSKGMYVQWLSVAARSYHGLKSPREDRIFISYCQQDEKENSNLFRSFWAQLDTLKNANISYFKFKHFEGEENIDEEIGHELKLAKLALRLVSANYINSPYIKYVERPLINDAAKYDGLIARWLPIGACSLTDTEFKRRWSFTGDTTPLNNWNIYPKPEREKILMQIAMKCRELLGK